MQTGNSDERWMGRNGPHLALQSPTTENAPAGSRGDFWGYYREERYVSLYMWIRGRLVGPLMRRERFIVGGDGRHMGGAEPSHEVFVRSPYRSSSLNP